VDDGVLVKFDYQYLQQLLEDQTAPLPPELHKELVDNILQRAITNQSQTA
jgi:uncharacterized protein (DUF2336 family)